MKKTKPISNFKFQFISLSWTKLFLFFFMTDWATPRRQSDTYSRGAAWWHATSLRWWRGKSTPCGSYQLTADSCNNLHGSCRTVALTLTHSVAVATSTYRAGIPSTRSRAHYECNGLTDNWPSWPRVRATSGRQAGSAVRQIVLPLLIGNFWHAQQRFLYRFMMTTNERRAGRRTDRGKSGGTVARKDGRNILKERQSE